MAAKRSRGRPRKFDEEAQVFSLRLPASLHAAIRDYADENGFSMNTLLLKAARSWWETVAGHERYDRAVRPEPPASGAKARRGKS
jgi:hypothetical protein